MLRQTLTLIVLVAFVLSAARPNVSSAAQPTYDVFASSAVSGSTAGVFFVEVQTGLSTPALTNGLNPTLLGESVIFADKGTGKVGVAHPDGRVAPHPFINSGPSDSAQSVNWAVSADHSWIVWAASRTQANSLLTDLFVAQADGHDKHLILHTSSTKGVGTRPLAISNDGATVFYSRQANDPKAYLVYPVAADIYRLNVATGDSTHLSGEPRCACAATVSANGQQVFRLEALQAGFAAHFANLAIGSEVVSGPPATTYTQAGYALLSDSGTLAVYSMAKGTAPAKGSPPEQYVLVLADATQKQQRILLNASPNRLRPLAFEQDTLILIGVDKDGTYKLSLPDGALSQVSAYSYLGTIQGASAP